MEQLFNTEFNAKLNEEEMKCVRAHAGVRDRLPAAAGAAKGAPRGAARRRCRAAAPDRAPTL